MSSDRVARMPLVPGPIASGYAALRRIITGVDDHLSRRQNVQSFSDDPTCILRYAPTLATQAFRLSDGVEIRPGDTVIDIHCWNERVPPMPAAGPDLAWALQTAGKLRASLRLLARSLDATPALRQARACRARVNFVGRGRSNESVSRIIHRLGFEDVDEGDGSLPHRFHDALENVLIGLLVWTHNPEALRRDKMIRERRPVWSSRERLLALHGPAAATPAVGDGPRGSPAQQA